MRQRFHKRTLGGLGAIAVAASMGVLGIRFFATSSPARPPNLLLVTLDTTRADRIGAYGHAPAQTPHLDRLAAHGVLFERAISAAPITLPAHASLFTGVDPFTHGVRDNGGTLSDTQLTLTRQLQSRGYRTAAFVSAFVLERQVGLAHGFEHYDDQLEERGRVGGSYVERRGERTAAQAVKWIAAHAGASGPRTPFFVWLHLFDPHDPYDPPPPFRASFADRPYDGEIAAADAALGRVLEALDTLGLRTSTIVAVAGDHGESLGDHGEDTHAMFLYESALRVPMIIAAAGRLPAGARVTQMVRAVDLSPTLLDVMGAPPLPKATGRTLVPLIESDGRAGEGAYSETYFPLFYMNWSPLRALQDGRWKYIDAPAPELYDLANDPDERSNLAAREPGRTSALKRALEAMTAGAPAARASKPVDSATAERLAALGYIGAHSAGNADVLGAGKDLPDPKAMIGVFNQLRRANASLESGRADAAATVARAVTSAHPDNAFAWQILGRALLTQGLPDQALVALRAYVTRVPSSADGHHWIALTYARLGDSSSALAAVDAALAIDARHDEARLLRAGLLSEAGRLDDALTEAALIVRHAPTRASFRVALARLLVDAQRRDEAAREFQRAIALEAENADAHIGYGALLADRNELEAAITSVARGLTIQPSQHAARLYYANLLARAHRITESRAEYQQLLGSRQVPENIRLLARRALAKLSEGDR